MTVSPMAIHAAADPPRANPCARTRRQGTSGRGLSVFPPPQKAALPLTCVGPAHEEEGGDVLEERREMPRRVQVGMVPDAREAEEQGDLVEGRLWRVGGT